MNKEITEAIGRLLAPSTWYRQATYHIESASGNVASYRDRAEDAISRIDVIVNISGNDDDVHVDAQINGMAQEEAGGAVAEMAQAWEADSKSMLEQTINSLFDDMKRTFGKLDPKTREIAEETGVRDDWMELVYDLNAIVGFAEFATENLSTETTLWLLNGIEGSYRRPHMLTVGIQHLPSLARWHGWEKIEPQVECWLAAANNMGPDKSALPSLYLASDLSDPDRRIASVMDRFDFNLNIKDVNWGSMIEYATDPGTRTTRKMVGHFLERHMDGLAERFPQIIGEHETDRKPFDAPLSQLTPANFPEGIPTLGELVAIVEEKALNQKLSTQLEGLRIAARTPEAKGSQRGMRL